MIAVDDVLEQLGYAESPAFLGARDLESLPGYAHIFRQAAEFCGLVGVYALRKTWDSETTSSVPVVYVCDAKTEESAAKLHRIVWNQNVVPFVIVRAPDSFRLYSGFAFDREAGQSSGRSGTKVLSEFVKVADFATKVVPRFCADRIDDGTLWRNEARFLTQELRVDWKLLENLEKLGHRLHRKQKLPLSATHSLIGKYVYLRYLRDRGILSDERLTDAGVGQDDIFGRDAKLSKLQQLIDYLDVWLNGSVFDIPWNTGVRAEHVREVAAAFYGDNPATGQRSLFEDYNFSFIPIETLSVVYEQFLHEKGEARKSGAYYTPIPLVNFVLDSMEELKPLRAGMRVLDPSCGSGAFLVQCYRRLIENELARRKSAKLRPTELRQLLQDHIFGIDRDESACQVAELSLSLTLLDYIDPPDLTKTNFKLPPLRGRNIFGGNDEDFFNTNSSFHTSAGGAPFDWIVGNPPWTEISTENPRAEDHYAFRWMQKNEEACPTGGNQVAELFAWKVTAHAKPTGAIGLLLPAMTLFKDESTEFRKQFFRKCRVESVVNFANLAYVLFAGRAEDPCAAFFYRTRKSGNATGDESIVTFAPFVLDQEPNRPSDFNRKLDTWTIVVNGSEVRGVATDEAAKGHALTWKLAMWGSYRDGRLLGGVASEFDALSKIAKRRNLHIHEGFQPRRSGEFIPEISGKPRLRRDAARKLRHSFSIPRDALEVFPSQWAYARPGRGVTPVLVSRPPHIVCDASRRFAIFSDQFIVIGSRQPAISGPPSEAQFLKLLSIYLNSDFAIYHQLLCAPRWGIHVSDSNLDTLKLLPTPIEAIAKSDVDDWLALHSNLVSSSPSTIESAIRKVPRPHVELRQSTFFDDRDSSSVMPQLLDELNERVCGLVGLSETERMLVEDFVQFRRFANKGRFAREAAGVPEIDELSRYANVLSQELDAYFEDDPNYRHRVTVAFDSKSQMGMVEIESQLNSSRRIRPKVETAGNALSQGLTDARQRIRSERPQWLYFERNLRLYEGSRIYMTKPLQRIHWLRSQALLDADSIIRDVLAQGP